MNEQDKINALITYKVAMYESYLLDACEDFLTNEYNDRIGPAPVNDDKQALREQMLDHLTETYSMVLTFDDINQWWAKERRQDHENVVGGDYAKQSILKNVDRDG